MRLNVEKDPSEPTDSKGKWAPNWDGPYMVKRAFFGEALVLSEMMGMICPIL